MESLPRYYLSSDFALLCAGLGLSIRTAAAVRNAVREGRLSPSGVSPLGVNVWTEQDAKQKALELRQDAALRLRAGAHIRRFQVGREPLQLEIPEEESA